MLLHKQSFAEHKKRNFFIVVEEIAFNNYIEGISSS